MKLKVSVFVFLLFIIISCKEHETQNKIDLETTKTEKPQLKKVKRLVFDIDLETSKPDDFRCFTNNVFLNNSQFMDIGILHKLNSNETSKKMRFVFPEGIQPDYQIGFSLGNKNVKDVKINGIIVSYGDLVYNITPKNFNKYFRLNRFVKYNEETGILKTQKNENKLNPIFFLRNPFIEKIQQVN